MSDTVGTTLTSQQVTDIIARAKSGGGNRRWWEFRYSIYVPLDQTPDLWRDFVITELTATGAALQIWYRA